MLPARRRGDLVRPLVSITVALALAIASRNALAQHMCVTPGPFSAPPVRISSDRPVVLQVREAHRQYRTVCAAPCDMHVPMSGTYRISGDGIRASKDFKFHETCGNPITLRVETSATGIYVAGILMIPVASATIMGSLVAGLKTASAGGSGGAVALVGVGAGVGILAAGLVIRESNIDSSVRQTDEDARRMESPTPESSFGERWPPRNMGAVVPMTISF